MTIEYTKKTFPPPPYDEEVLDMLYYRLLYEGEHAEIFPRAKTLVKTEKRRKIRANGLRRTSYQNETVTTVDQYVVANFAGLIAEIPADLLNRAIGNISADTEEGPELDFVSNVVTASKPSEKLWAAVTQHQVDGLVAYRVRRDSKGKVWFEWILGDRYFPHDDNNGADIAWIEEWGEDNNKDKYLRVERQRLTDAGLTVQQMVFVMDGDTVGEAVEIKTYSEKYELDIPDDMELSGVTELLCNLVTNDETLLKSRGRSALRNIDGLQEEINWTITRDSIVFEKHGKPKLAIPKGLWDTVANDNAKMYGGQRFVRNADLEVVSYNENNGAVPMYIVWDAKTDQSFKHVERLIKYMLSVSKTSPQAAGLEEGTGAKAAVAMLYEWMVSVIKAEAVQSKFDAAIKDAIRKCMILENALGSANLEVKAPVIEWGDMLPKADSERDTEEIAKYDSGVQSLEVTVRKMHPDWSEEAIQAEIQKIMDETAANALPPTQIQPPKVTL